MNVQNVKKCRACKKSFEPTRFAQVVCGPLCAIKDIKIQREKKRKEQRKIDKVRLEEMKSKPKLIKEVQKEFNHFIRLRDRHCPCISCGRVNALVEVGNKTGGHWDCGHYLSVGSHPELRFCEDNAYKQCKSCNGGSGKYTKKNYTVANAYRENLVKRVGPSLVDWLEGPHDIPNYTKDDLRELRSSFRAKCKELLKAQP